MGDVVNLFSNELKSCSYYECEDEIGVAMLDSSVIVLPLNDEEFELTFNGVSALFKREELAEFLHVAAICIDSEQRYLPEIELFGRNYKD